MESRKAGHIGALKSDLDAIDYQHWKDCDPEESALLGSLHELFHLGFGGRVFAVTFSKWKAQVCNPRLRRLKREGAKESQRNEEEARADHGCKNSPRVLRIERLVGSPVCLC